MSIEISPLNLRGSFNNKFRAALTPIGYNKFRAALASLGYNKFIATLALIGYTKLEQP